ncbi:hypothetical protein B0T26DRAFT_749454 [Lasiosphaeria miniovina]|uniref:Uncharacterized protein n=1 Tax=Lasiosphaeria miniovina TaxID=1954250 RepID=A0AA40E1Y3_9PEZI|nr:uncharacterized protein B0T26DRAFT_749454 [Lasiosphaeria miniovina]KAK0721987.1 hypothetical protein B0T26DRAFT_749454 [Lasiosphaeria miniovina]
MAHPSRSPIVYPFEARDQQDRAEVWHNDPLRIMNKQLADENLRLKKLLRENGLSWSTPSREGSQLAHAVDSMSPPLKKVRRTRSSAASDASEIKARLPTLPVEVQLQILEYAMTSEYPIVDPLCVSDSANTTSLEKARGNQIAIGFLVTCRAYLVEGTQYLWNKNTFVFTSHVALRNFSNLSLDFRKNIKHVNFRIIARYYDDEKRTHSMSQGGSRKSVKLKVNQRVKEHNLARRGFRSYTWMQTADFLDALLPPFDPNHNKTKARPRLLPNLESLRIDFVNFGYNFLTFPDPELHQLTVHDLGCSLNELMLTGLPICDAGHKAASDLTGMVKDEGLLLKAKQTFIQSSSQVRPMPDGEVDAKTVRTWKALAKEYAEANNSGNSDYSHMAHHFSHGLRHTDLPEMPPAPKEVGHPESIWKKRPTVWKRVPKSRDSEEREWVEFDRTMGQSMDNWTHSDKSDTYDLHSLVCDRCGEIHDPLSWDD